SGEREVRAWRRYYLSIGTLYSPPKNGMPRLALNREPRQMRAAREARHAGREHDHGGWEEEPQRTRCNARPASAMALFLIAAPRGLAAERSDRPRPKLRAAACGVRTGRGFGAKTLS